MTPTAPHPWSLLTETPYYHKKAKQMWILDNMGTSAQTASWRAAVQTYSTIPSTMMGLGGGTASIYQYPGTAVSSIFASTGGGVINSISIASNQLAHNPPYNPSQSAAPRRVNRFLATSDMLEEFLREMSAEGIGRASMLDLPIELFVSWLVVKAAEADQETVPENVTDPRRRIHALPKRHLCRGCNNEITADLRARGLQWCSAACVGLAFEQRRGVESFTLETGASPKSESQKLIAA